MSATVAAAVKAAIVILSNEEARKKVGWGIVAILSPLIVLVVLLCAILSGTSQHNVSAVELCFHGGSISASATPEYQRYIEDMRNSFDQLDEVIAEINSQCEDGKSLDDTRVKAIFYALYFAAEQPVLWSSFFVTLVAKKIVLINLCCRPCFIWGSITIITVWTNMIIINVCKFFYLLIECFLCCKLIQICAFILQGIEVTLHRCIVVRISCFAHALCHIYRFAEFGKCFGRIL